MKLLAAITIGLVVLAPVPLQVATAPEPPTLTVKINTGYQKTIDGKMLQGGNL